MRRDSKDLEWKKAKAEVKERDGLRCRLIRVLSYKEMLLLKKNAGPLITPLDPAHYIAVSENPNIMYMPENIVMLNRYSHTNLDNCRNPITGEPITKAEALRWWDRILRGNKVQYNYLKENHILKELEQTDGECQDGR